MEYRFDSMEDIPNVVPPELVDQCMRDVQLMMETVDGLYEHLCTSVAIEPTEKMSNQIHTWSEWPRVIKLAFGVGEDEVLAELELNLDTGEVTVCDAEK